MKFKMGLFPFIIPVLGNAAITKNISPALTIEISFTKGRADWVVTKRFFLL